MDQRVEVTGTSKQDVNGQCGLATDFHPLFHPDGGITLQSRYTVLLDSGQTYKLKLGNVRAERADASQTRPKTKGKGKKGRGKGGR